MRCVCGRKLSESEVRAPEVSRREEEKKEFRRDDTGYEYMSIENTFMYPLDSRLNELAVEGWRPIHSSYDAARGWTFLFERKRRSINDVGPDRRDGIG